MFGKCINHIRNYLQNLDDTLHIIGLEQILSDTNPCLFKCVQLIFQRVHYFGHLSVSTASALFHLSNGITRLVKVRQNSGANLSLSFAKQGLQQVGPVLVRQIVPDVGNIRQNIIGGTIGFGIVLFKQTDATRGLCRFSQIGNRTCQFSHTLRILFCLLIVATDTHG